IWPTEFLSMVTSAVRAPMRADMYAASHPACPPPITITSNSIFCITSLDLRTKHHPFRSARPASSIIAQHYRRCLAETRWPVLGNKDNGRRPTVGIYNRVGRLIFDGRIASLRDYLLNWAGRSLSVSFAIGSPTGPDTGPGVGRGLGLGGADFANGRRGTCP